MHKQIYFDQESREDVLQLSEMLRAQYPDADISVSYDDDTVVLDVETQDEDVFKSIMDDINSVTSEDDFEEQDDDDESENAAWWQEHANEATSFAENNKDFLADLLFEDEDDDARVTFNDSTAKHQALTVLDILGAKDFEALMKEVNNAASEPSDADDQSSATDLPSNIEPEHDTKALAKLIKGFKF